MLILSRIRRLKTDVENVINAKIIARLAQSLAQIPIAITQADQKQLISKNVYINCTMYLVKFPILHHVSVGSALKYAHGGRKLRLIRRKIRPMDLNVKNSLTKNLFFIL